MVLDDDNDEKWDYREHTAAKHEIYQKYLTPWTFKLTHLNREWGKYNKIRVVDCFAGRGSYTQTVGCEPPQMHHIDTPAEIPGSPQIILDQLTQHSDKFAKAEAKFIEQNDTNFGILEETIEGTTGVASNVESECIHGKFQEEVLDTVDSTDGSDCPTLFFIDPFGFKSLDYDVVTEIGSTPRFEFLITFMSRDINRFFEVEKHENAIETVFGDSRFREKVEEYDPENWEALVEYYTDRLEENGPEHTFEYLLTEPDTQQTVYYLVFGTNHPQGLVTMREVMANCGTGGFAYAPRNVEYHREQTGLGSFTSGASSAKQFLKNTFDDVRIEFGQLIEKASEVRKYEDDMASDYRTAIKELEEEGEVSVIRRASEKQGVQKGDLIDFREGIEVSSIEDF